ncbi:MAG: divalent-cation tolerance protein CutA [Pseudomonadota bacterium]
MTEFILCLVTIDDYAKAVEIARRLVEAKMAACVNIIPEIRSVYSWKGKICDETERLLIIKTRRGLFEDLKDAVRAMHPYEVPEIISISIDEGLPEYLKWIHENVEAEPRHS